MSKEKPLRDLLRESIINRKLREGQRHTAKEHDRRAWIARSVAWNLERIRRAASDGGGFQQVTSIDGTDAVHPGADRYKDRYPELLRQLEEIGKKEGFAVIPSPAGVVPGWWIVWDHEAWETRDAKEAP